MKTKQVLHFCQQKNNFSITNTEVILAKEIKGKMDGAKFRTRWYQKRKMYECKETPAKRESLLTQLNHPGKP
jgi:hypothetical protein